MSQRPLNAAGGAAFVVQASLPDPDVARLLRLAELTGKSRSATARELLHDALNQADAEGRDPP
jgi:hypothetical protein